MKLSRLSNKQLKRLLARGEVCFSNEIDAKAYRDIISSLSKIKQEINTRKAKTTAILRDFQKAYEGGIFNGKTLDKYELSRIAKPTYALGQILKDLENLEKGFVAAGKKIGIR